MQDETIIDLLADLIEAKCPTHQQALLRSLEAGGAGDRAAQVLGARSLSLLGFEPRT